MRSSEKCDRQRETTIEVRCAAGAERKTVGNEILCFIPAAAWFLLSVLWAGPLWAQDLRGEITTEQLYVNAPLFERNAREFTPSAEAVERIGKLDRNMEIVVFLGTWCHDSSREVPRLLKILETASNPHISLEMHAVDPEIEDGAGFTEQYGVHRVPTIVFMQEGRELGRIVEHPSGTMEEALLRIAGSGL